MKGRATRVALLASVGTIAACSLVVAPEERSVQAIVLTAPASFADVLARVNRVHIRVTRPGAIPRDTVLQPLFQDGQVRARAILRPDEADPGTLVEIDLKNHGSFLFKGAVVVGPESGWPFTVRVPVTPIGTFDAGPDRVLALGDDADLNQGATLVLGDGEIRTPVATVWLPADSSVVRIDAGIATAIGVGQTTVLAVWYQQIDTIGFVVQPGPP